ncbi:MAG TPA: hypothetical protein DCO79_08470 [Spirochaeta sp.]|nr:hypothetical protein [Spirochaeta sp.]
MTALVSSKYIDIYEKYKYDEITFSGTIIKSSGIVQRDLFLISGNSQWPCTILTASMTGVRVSVTLSVEEISKLSESSSVQLHFSFMGLKPHFIPIAFSVPYRITELTNTSSLSAATHMLTLAIAVPPPDFLIKLFGDLMNIQTLTTKRAETRVNINSNTAEELGLKSTHCRLKCGEVLQDCRLKDISLTGCQIILNSENQITNKRVILEVIFRDPDSITEIEGRVIRLVNIKESRDKASAGVLFEKARIPHEYTERIHKLLN